MRAHPQRGYHPGLLVHSGNRPTHTCCWLSLLGSLDAGFDCAYLLCLFCVFTSLSVQDCHPGNLHVDAQYGGRLIYYDFGMCSSISPSVRQGFVNTVFSIYEGTPQDFCDGLAAICSALKPPLTNRCGSPTSRSMPSSFSTWSSTATSQ